MIRTDGLTMAEWAAQQQASGRMLVGASAGGNGEGAVMREWARRQAEKKEM